MIHFSIPYCADQNFLEAINREFDLVTNPKDWMVIMDGDTMFLQSDFGTQLQEYIEKYPNTGMFTSYASRCSYHYQVPEGVDQENPSIIYHKIISDRQRAENSVNAIRINTRIAGHLMMIRKDTWISIYPEVKRRVSVKNKKVLGVDTQISWAVIKSGRKILLMKGVYVLHYFRLLEGRNAKLHLK